jgi:ATP-dependent DNA helicase Q1
VTLDSWRIIRVAEEVQRQGGRVTLGNLGDLVRGLGGGGFGMGGGATGKKRKGAADEKGSLNLIDLVGGKVGLGKDVSYAMDVQSRILADNTKGY